MVGSGERRWGFSKSAFLRGARVGEELDFRRRFGWDVDMFKKGMGWLAGFCVRGDRVWCKDFGGGAIS